MERREGVRIDTQDLSDGKRIVSRYEDGILVTESHFETLASGKQIHRQFDASKSLTLEIEFYEAFAIAIQSRFLNGSKTSETYFVKGRLAARRTYEKARLTLCDMPAPDESFRDVGSELLKGVAAERKAAATRRKTHAPDSEQAVARDKFCRERIAAGTCTDALMWLHSSNHTLGEMNHGESRRLVNRLLKHGAVRILACEIDDYGESGQNTGHLVIELPKEEALRLKLFKALARIAESHGFAGDADDGQTYAYVKLD